ncbi:TonB-dependent receptor [Aquimarina sp. TRL1]|uniref:TonB-dependent receptor n=1 Tax=Aquimarina sp. (strain TRL1) TaxID=2736252 RepID=UPI00158E69EB|nr:TonB-dependent receptor [Aquimarina sp. TRL1]QKX04414.1 TonB-dependent receptor [Aquimarina sp. TRL1]
MKKITTFLACLFVGILFAQEKGSISGMITDKESNDSPLPFANVVLKGTTIGTATDFDGKYTIDNIPVGTYIVEFSFTGYETVTIPNVVVEAGKNVVIDTKLGATAAALEEVLIKVETSKEKEEALLLEQKNAVKIEQKIGAQELSRKGVSDATAAATKISGVAKQEGSNKVYVRGLGDRYNATTLNNLPLPSNDPANKNISLDLFPTDVIQNLSVSKAFSYSQTGDAAGANININSKVLQGKGGLTVGISSGFNSQTIGVGEFQTIDGANWIGFADHTTHQVTDLTVYPFDDNLATNKSGVTPLNLGASVNWGKKYDVGEEGSFSAFLVGSFSSGYTFRDGISINFNNDGTFGSNYPEAKEFKYASTKVAMGNFTYKINPNNKISYNALLVQSNDQKVQDYLGTKPDVADNENELARVVQQTQSQNLLAVNQLLSEHKLGESYDLNLGASYNIVKNDEPNRKKNIFIINTADETTLLASGTPRNNSRYYHNLKEDDITAKVSLSRYLGNRIPDENKGKVTFDYTYRNTQRDFEAIYFDYNLSKPTAVDPNNLEATLNQEAIDNNVFRFTTGFGSGDNALDPFTYNGGKTIQSASIGLDYKISDRFFVNIGGKFEDIKMEVEWLTNLTNSNDENGGPLHIDNTYVLPSLNLKYNVSEKHILRLAASQTYTYPQFKEVAPFVYEGIDYLESGNPDLKPSDNYNIDLKWETYPKKDELISATIFGKQINEAINRIERISAADRNFTYANLGDATIAGVEVEIKKNLYTLEDDTSEKVQKVTFGANATYMYTNLKFKDAEELQEQGISVTEEESELEGAAPLLINSDISYRHIVDKKEFLATLVFSYQADKVYGIGSNFNNNTVQKSFANLDLILERKFNERLGIKLKATNLLDNKIEQVRDVPQELVMRSYNRGINFSLGMSYKF